MDNRKATRTASMSKSSPALSTTFGGKKRLQHHLKRTSGGVKRAYLEYERDIVENAEKSVATQRNPYLILEKRVNVTPKPLYDPFYVSASEKHYAGLPATKPLKPRGEKIVNSSSASSLHSFASRYSFSRRSRGSMAQSVMSGGAPSLGEVSWATFMPPRTSEEDEEVELVPEDRAPSMFRLREDPPPKKGEVKTKFTVMLQESETMFMLVIPTGAVACESDQGKAFTNENAEYDMAVSTSKTKSTMATQTTKVFQKHCKLYAPRNDRVNSDAWATVWDIYDTYEKELHLSTQSVTLREGQIDKIKEVHEEADYVEEFEYLGCKFDGKLLNALMVMERIIEREHYREKQLQFQGLLVEDPLSVSVKCQYTLKLLWTFKNQHTKNRKVTSICNCPRNQNIIAVGYGKFKYTDKCSGLVCIWNVKNPNTPERYFKFEDPVTFVAFSNLRSQILAITFYSGLVLLLDIITRSTTVKASNSNYPLYYPVWQARWFGDDDFGNTKSQCVITCGKNGRVYRYKKTKFFISKKIMSMDRPHGNIQGVPQPKKCYARKVLSCRHPSAEVLVPHPSDPLIYLIGTSEGCVYVCSVNHRHDHLDVFVAHSGPVYTIQFNPFCSKVFLTSGADWCIRIWAETVFEPLITLESGMAPVQDAVWNPLHSTIIVSVTGHFIEIWDIRRKISTPKSSTESPSKTFNTVLQFTQNKYNVCVGDTDGNVHVMALTEMPFSPHFQEEVLVRSIENVLVTRPEILYKLVKLGPPFASENFSYKSKMYRKLDHLHKAL